MITFVSRQESNLGTVVAVWDSHVYDDLALRRDLIEGVNVDVDGGFTLGVGDGEGHHLRNLRRVSVNEVVTVRIHFNCSQYVAHAR